MRHYGIIIFLTFFINYKSYGQLPFSDPNWQLDSIFSDDFGDTSIDKNKWERKFHWSNCKCGDKDTQVYLTKRVRLSNGLLHLDMFKDENTCDSELFHFSGGVIHSKYTRAYGYYEINALIPIGRGYWPAFWLHNAWGDLDTTPPCPYFDYQEVDIVENNGEQSEHGYLGSNMWWLNKQTCKFNNVGNMNAPNILLNDIKFHKFAILWLPATISYYFDSSLFRLECNNNKINDELKVIISYGIDPINNPPYPTLPSGFIDSFTVDWFHRWELKISENHCNDTVLINCTFKPANFTYNVKKNITIGTDNNCDSTDLVEFFSNNNIVFYATDGILINGNTYIHSDANNGQFTAIVLGSCPEKP
jgi:beta-glucanase (GH16 family)